MKKLSIFLCAMTAIAAISCNKEIQEIPENPEPQTPQVELFPMTFTATTADTRTVLDDDQEHILWTEGERISVFDGAGNREFTSGGTGRKVTFSGNAASANVYYALYPYDGSVQLSGTSVTTTLASAQTPRNGSFADGLNINAAQSTDKTTFVFDNVLSVAKFTLDATKLGGKTIKSVKFASKSYPLAGDLVINFGETCTAEPSTAETAESFKEVSMTDANGLADGTYFLLVLPNAGGEITMTFESTDGFIARKTATLNSAFTAGYIKNLGTVQGLVWTKVFFYESFDKCTGTGGNDGLWGGSIATSNLNPDNEGWSAASMNGANKCAKAGSGSKIGAFTSPAIDAVGSVSLSFKAAPWDSDGTSLTVTTNPAISVVDGDCTMVKGRFTEFDVTLNNFSSGTTITFTPVKRFFLDEVLVYVGDKNLAFELAKGETIPAPVISPSSGTYTSAQTVTITADGADRILYGINAEPDTEYTGPLTISSSCTLKAVAVKGSITSDVAEAVYTMNISGQIDATYDFTKIDFSGWTNGYLEHIVVYSEATVTFEAASKQSGNMAITDQPVTKTGAVKVVLKEGTMSSVKFVCKQWNSKKKTITLNYSTDGGETFTTTGITSSNFMIESNNLPAKTNAVSITFDTDNQNDNQIGITSVEFKGIK